MKPTRALIDLALSAVAGYVGTKAMEPVSMKLYELESPAARAREDAARPGAPYRIAAEKLTGVFGLEFTDEQLDRLSLAFHYSLAIQWAPLYPLLRRRTGLGPAAAALATGAAMSVVADELMTPAFGFSAANLDYPLVTHVRGFLAHLTFGLAAAAVVETGWRITGTRP
ncbi:DUF1440 domain-containing protein [Blastococcus goldschmidtiae]|uniref:DUF1440 domain-containing protein n=1 Tax=Blastococcus goldschmidtiae TaxID=3075546 RepID=A0ABU2KDH2_9ACTN|nr:DUF1440 domain-containing protein [Blastococcus sp. DSM 46792]MDT0278235.1 DUF1440 domain-containing protein [Blastococcus sp. DSM 46792]